jgi:hypothetical protein
MAEGDVRELFEGLNIGPIDEFAMQAKSMFDAFMRQGFTERQAVHFCAEWMVRVAEKGESE